MNKKTIAMLYQLKKIMQQYSCPPPWQGGARGGSSFGGGVGADE